MIYQQAVKALTHPKFHHRRWTGALHAWEHRVFTKGLSRRQLEAMRLAEAGHHPQKCSCGGLRYTEPPCLVDGLVVLSVARCTGCTPAVEAC